MTAVPWGNLWDIRQRFSGKSHLQPVPEFVNNPEVKHGQDQGEQNDQNGAEN